MIKKFYIIIFIAMSFTPTMPCLQELNACDQHGNTGLMLAVARNDLDGVNFFIEKKANPNIMNHNENVPLTIATYAGYLDIAETLIEKGNANINILNTHGNTPLMIMVMLNKCEAVKFLINQKANPDIADEYGRTPLALAVLINNFDIVQYLILHGNANPNIADQWGNTPLSLAKRNSNKEIADFLLKHGANSNMLQPEFETY